MSRQISVCFVAVDLGLGWAISRACMQFSQETGFIMTLHALPAHLKTHTPAMAAHCREKGPSLVVYLTAYLTYSQSLASLVKDTPEEGDITDLNCVHECYFNYIYLFIF